MKKDLFVSLGPMAGITDYPFRKMVLKFGASAVTTEMISSEALTRNSQKTLKRLTSFNENCTKIVQIVGCDKERMAESAKMNQSLGADIIDINMGCPVKKIINSYAGSALMKDEKLACEIVESVVQSVSIPVTVKMRLGWDLNSLNAHILAKRFQDFGVIRIAIHGRTRSQMYSGTSDWNAIKQTTESIKIPVLCNGDIKNFSDAQAALTQSNAFGVMIARGAIGSPWILKKIMCEYLNEPFNMPTVFEQKELVKEHLFETINYYGKEPGICIFRKHLCAYSKGLIGANDFRVKINSILDLQELLRAIDDFYNMNLDLI